MCSRGRSQPGMHSLTTPTNCTKVLASLRKLLLLPTQRGKCRPAVDRQGASVSSGSLVSARLLSPTAVQTIETRSVSCSAAALATLRRLLRRWQRYPARVPISRFSCVSIFFHDKNPKNSKNGKNNCKKISFWHEKNSYTWKP